MNNRVAAVAATNRASLERTSTPVARSIPESAPRPAAKSEHADLRLIIEEDTSVGAYVYKTVDRNTGEVISQFPREEVLKLRDSAEYEVGDVAKTRA